MRRRHTDPLRGCPGAYDLAGKELNDNVDIDRQAEIAGAGKTDHGGPEGFGVERDPVGSLLAAAVAHDALVEIVDRLFRPDGDHVAGAELVAGTGDLDAVHVEVTVNDA